jgi:hypothetical protein
MIPVSTAMWDPKWFHGFTGDEDYIFKDKRGIYNGIRASIFLMSPDYQCDCGPKCLNHDPQSCNFLKDYKAHLDTLDFNYVMSELERIANKVQKMEGFSEEPIIVLIVYETPSNPCSERKPLQDWFKENNYILNEWSINK